MLDKLFLFLFIYSLTSFYIFSLGEHIIYIYILIAMSENCIQLFCGCDYYRGFNQQIDSKVYFAIGFMLVILTVCVRIGSEWFIFKDYYPMKERSPVLCIMMITCISMQLIIYPLAYTYNYFTRNWGDFKYIYRTLFYAFDGSLYILYLMRSLRLVYAHEIDISRSKTWLFKFLKHQYFLVAFLVTISFLKIIPILISNSNDEDLFLTFIDVNTYTYGQQNQQLGFGIKEIIHEFIWLSVLIYCLWLQTLVHRKYSMKNQLLLVLGIGFSFNIVSIGLYLSEIGQPSIVKAICDRLPQYPILQLLRDFNVFGYFVISIVIPLCKKRIYHMLLPTGRHHDIVKTMRDFLMETQFINIFEKFLAYQDDEQATTRNCQTLDYWKKLMVIKFKATGRALNDDELRDCVSSIKDLIKNIEDKPIKDIHANLITHLKQSILSLQECEEKEEIQERYKYLDQINQKIQQLELIFLEKLDHIYKTEFRQTKSYYFLKMYMMRNKKININMITMGMAVMVESEDAL